MNKKRVHYSKGGNLSLTSRQLLRAVLVAAIYFFSFFVADISLYQFSELPGVVAWYPPAGITVALLLVFGVRFSPLVTLAYFLSGIFVHRMPYPALQLFLWAFITSLVYAAGAAFLRKLIRLDPQLKNFRDIGWLIVTTFVSSAILAVLSVPAALYQRGLPGSELFRVFFHWWIGESVGVLSVTPFLLIFVMPGLKRVLDEQKISWQSGRSLPRSIPVLISQVASFLLVLYWVFGARIPDDYNPLFLVALPLIWVALDYGFKGASLALLGLNSGVVLAVGWFGIELHQLARLEMLMIILCIIGLLMGAVVTERKRTERTLSASESKLRALFASMQDAVLVIDRDGVYLEIAPTNLEKQPLSPRELLGRKLEDFFPEQQAQFFHEKIEKVLDTQQGTHIEYQIDHGGQAVWYQASVSPMGADRTLWVARDITDQVLAEQKLLESEHNYRGLVDNALIGVYRTRLDGTILLCNPELARILNYEDCAQLYTRNIQVHYKNQEDRQRLLQILEKEGGTTNYEIDFLTRDGKTRTAILSASLQDGIISGMFLDITERKRAEAERMALLKILQGSVSLESLHDLLELIRQALDQVICAENFFVVFKNKNSGLFEELYSVDKYDPPMPPSRLEKSITSYVFRTGEPLLMTDEKFESLVSQGEVELVGTNSFSWLGAPLKTPVETIGVMAVQNYEQRDCYTERDRDFFAFVALQVSMLLERKLAEEQVRNQMEIQGALYDLTRKLVGMDDFNAILDLVTRSAVETVHVTFACMIILEQGDLVIRSAYPVRVLDQEVKLGQPEPLADHPFCKRALEGNDPLVLSGDNPEAGEFTSFFLGISQNLCIVPLHFQDQPFGILLLGEARHPARESFTPQKIRLADSIGDQAASALHRARLGEQARLRLQRIACLREIDNTIARTTDLRLSLDMVLKHVVGQLKVDAAAILVVNISPQTLEFKAGRGFRTQAVEHIQQQVTEGQAGKAILERRMIHYPDVTPHLDQFARPDLMKIEQAVSYIAMPLIVKGKANGVLEIYHRSPLNPDNEWFDFLNTLAGQAAIAIDNDKMFYGLQRSNFELVLAYDATIEGWSHALDLRDRETEGHTLRVTEITVKMAQLFGISSDELKQVRWGALLHDIGKLGVPDAILHKPGPLTEEEWVLMKKHPQFAFEMISPVKYLQSSLDIPYCHHEKWDGSGYPRGLKDEQIPLAARIFAVVDVWDALTSDRPYRAAWAQEKALEYIRESSGSHFDPQVVKVFLKEVSEIYQQIYPPKALS